MFKNLFFVGLLLGLASGAQAQTGCALTITKSGTGLNRTYVASSTAPGATYYMEAVSFSENSLDSTSSSILSVSPDYGTYLVIAAMVSSPTCTDTVIIWDTLAGPINCALTAAPSIGVHKYWYPRYANEIPNQLTFTQDYSQGWFAPGYTRTWLYEYGDGSTGTEDFHNYSAPQSNTTVKLTQTYTHPNFPSCTVSNTTLLNIERCNNAYNKIDATYLSPNEYSFTNKPFSALPAEYKYVNRWYVVDPSGKETFQLTGNDFTYTFPNSGEYGIVATNSWYKPNTPNTLCISVDTLKWSPAPSNVSQFSKASFVVTPNPATDKLQINLGSATGKVNATLSNTAGQVVMQEVISGSSTTLSVSQLPAGMYLLQLQSGKEVRTEKVQIQH